MSSASDRKDKREDPIAFAPKWVRDPAHNQRPDEAPAAGEFLEPSGQPGDIPRLPRSLDPVIMREPPVMAGRGLRVFFGASIVGVGIVTVIVVLLIAAGISVEWRNADAPASGATSSGWTFAVKWPNPEQRNPPAPQRASAPAPVDPRSFPRGVTDKEVRYGISAPFTGPARELGQQMKLGIETALKLANDAGWVHRRQLNLIAAQHGHEPDPTPETMEQLYDNPQVIGIVGNVGTPTAVVALPYALEKRMLFFGAFTGANLLRRDPPDRYVFNYRASYPEETYAVVQYLVKVKRLQANQIAVFAQQDAYGDAGFTGVARAIRALGGNDAAILRLAYKRKTVDVDDAVARLRAHKIPIKAIVMVPTYRTAAKFIEKTRDLYPAMIYTNVSFVGSTAL